MRAVGLIACLISFTAFGAPASVNNPMPYIFSGTACRASGQLGPATEEGIPIWMELYLNDERVARWDAGDDALAALGFGPDNAAHGPLEFSLPSIPRSLAVIFDSTQFVDGATVTVRFEAQTGVGHFSASGQAIVKNRILLAEHPDMSGAIAVAGDLDHYPTFGQTYMYGAWTPRQFGNNLSGASVVFAATHGNPTSFAAGKKWQDGSVSHSTFVGPYGDDGHVVRHPEWENYIGVEPYRSPQMGSGYPPFNSTQNPPITLAFISACETGKQQDFIRFCLPYMNGYGKWLEDQAYTGFTTFQYVDDQEEIARTFFAALVTGKTIQKTRLALAQHTPPFIVSDTLEGEERVLSAEDVAIYGDTTTRLESVYTADHREPVGWHLP